MEHSRLSEDEARGILKNEWGQDYETSKNRIISPKDVLYWWDESGGDRMLALNCQGANKDLPFRVVQAINENFGDDALNMQIHDPEREECGCCNDVMYGFDGTNTEYIREDGQYQAGQFDFIDNADGHYWQADPDGGELLCAACRDSLNYKLARGYESGDNFASVQFGDGRWSVFTYSGSIVRWDFVFASDATDLYGLPGDNHGLEFVGALVCDDMDWMQEQGWVRFDIREEYDSNVPLDGISDYRYRKKAKEVLSEWALPGTTVDELDFPFVVDYGSSVWLPEAETDAFRKVLEDTIYQKRTE